MNTINIKARRKARKRLLQALYQWQLAGTSVDDIMMHYRTGLYLKGADVEYFEKVLFGVIEHSLDLDRALTPVLDRKIQALDPLECAILRMAVYEMRFCREVPPKVVINEAVELIKRFGATESYKFVNGVLDTLLVSTQKCSSSG